MYRGLSSSLSPPCPPPFFEELPIHSILDMWISLTLLYKKSKSPTRSALAS